MPAPRQYDIDPEWEAVLRADPCAYCGAPTRDLDHIVAVVRGGDDTAENLTSSCGRCNKSKHDTTLLIFLWKRALEDIPAPRSPRVGVHWRKDIKRWAAYVDLVRRHSLGQYDTPEDAIAAVEAWWRANPDEMSPRKRAQRDREEKIYKLWMSGKTIREIGEELGMPAKSAGAAVGWMQRRGDLPRVGRGGPGKSRPARAGVKVPGKGYRYTGKPTTPWLVQVQSGGHKLAGRFATEEEAAAAVAEFRSRHPRRASKT